MRGTPPRGVAPSLPVRLAITQRRCCAPARDQPGNVTNLQGGQIDRQQQKRGRVATLDDAAAHGTRETQSALRIGDKHHLEPARFGPVALGAARQRPQ